ncbi:MAG: DoxX family protein [Emcibacter sp.]|nr:DoxX family protein [Emcibacter sp.]
MNGDRFIDVALWVLSFILAIVFFYNGVNKIMETPHQVAQFEALGLPTFALPVVGIVECAAGLMLTITRLALVGGAILSIIMITSAGLNLFHDDVTSSLRAMVIFLMLLSICYLRYTRRNIRP